ncbi:hypothetical protein [Chamaesiphon sp.]|uniref:hypothetical protein n=1 Tax=Chamaesiphon sp. TaxID=2814140 RepID=UPI003593B477
MGYKSKLKQSQRPLRTASKQLSKYLNIRVLDTTSRRSWVLLHVSIPKWHIDITDWFHVFCEDDEHLQIEYTFDPADCGTATSIQLAGLLNILCNRIVTSFAYLVSTPDGMVAIDRFGELDTHSLWE